MIRFSLNPYDKKAVGSGLHALQQLRSIVAKKQLNVEVPAIPQEWLNNLCKSFTDVKNILKMDSAFQFSFGYQDTVDTWTHPKL